MKLSTSRKVYLALLGLAVMAFLVDRLFLGGPAAAPQQARASVDAARTDRAAPIPGRHTSMAGDSAHHALVPVAVHACSPGDATRRRSTGRRSRLASPTPPATVRRLRAAADSASGALRDASGGASV